MKVITCASYYGSGSSAITDLLSEYSSVKDTTNFELSFSYNLDGISDLEFHLVDCHNRRNAGYALKRFLRLAKFNSGFKFKPRYESFFQGKYYETTCKYVDSLTELKFYGWGFYDLYDKGGIAYYYAKQFQNHLLCRLFKKNQFPIKGEYTYCAHPSKEYFLKCTQDYTHELFLLANSERKPYLSVDQAISSQNINRLLRYFKDEMFVIIVKRDPRDIYSLERFCWKDQICPYDDVFDFCKWFKYNMSSGCKEILDQKHVITINFEDLIYDYDKTVKALETLTGLSCKDHKDVFSKFNPKRSVVNTMVWKNYDISNEISVIEEELADYLYDFTKVRNKDLLGRDVIDGSLF